MRASDRGRLREVSDALYFLVSCVSCIYLVVFPCISLYLLAFSCISLYFIYFPVFPCISLHRNLLPYQGVYDPFCRNLKAFQITDISITMSKLRDVSVALNIKLFQIATSRV